MYCSVRRGGLEGACARWLECARAREALKANRPLLGHVSELAGVGAVFMDVARADSSAGSVVCAAGAREVRKDVRKGAD